MSKRVYSDDLDNNSQKSHYFVEARKRSRGKSYVPSIFAKVLNTQQKHHSPFFRLFNERESEEDVQKRYQIYIDEWKRQQETVQRILNRTNIQLFESLAKYIAKTTLSGQKDDRRSKLSVGMLSLSSNKANNFRLLDEFNSYLGSHREETGLESVKVITLSSKNCANIKSTLREAVKQFVSVGDDANSVGDENLEEEETEGFSGNESEEDVIEPVVKSNQQQKKKNNIDFEAGLSYDFDVVENWCSEFYIGENSDVYSTKLRVVIILRDADSISTQVLNQLIKVLNSYSKSIPIRLILGLSTKNVSDWINVNLNNDVRMSINAFKFKSKSNHVLGHTILNELFLSDKDGSDQLAAHPKLASILLNRFENSNNSIDNIVYSIKLCYMIHFYQSPLSLLLDRSARPSKLHTEALRKLPSFKRYIEEKLYHFHQIKRDFEREKEKSELVLHTEYSVTLKEKSSRLENAKDEIKQLFNSDEKLFELVDEARTQFYGYRRAIIDLSKIIFLLQTDEVKSQFEIYKLLTSTKLTNSEFLKRFSKDLKAKPSAHLHSKIQSLLSSNSSSSIVKDSTGEVREFFSKLSKLTNDIPQLNSRIISLLKEYINNSHFKKSMEAHLFYELFTLDGGISLTEEKQYVEENQNNLMLDLLRPKLRHILETGLEYPDSYLKDELVTRDIKNLGKSPPIITLLFNLYKDAPASINIYDFYVAFKSSLSEKQIREELSKNIALHKGPEKETLLHTLQNPSSDWDKLTYAWFVQSCHELISIGFLKEKTKGDYLEKAIWKGI